MLLQGVLLSHKGQTQSTHLRQEPLVKLREEFSPLAPSLPLPSPPRLSPACGASCWSYFASLSKSQWIQTNGEPKFRSFWRAAFPCSPSGKGRAFQHKHIPLAQAQLHPTYCCWHCGITHASYPPSGSATPYPCAKLPEARQHISLACWYSAELRGFWTLWKSPWSWLLLVSDVAAGI